MPACSRLGTLIKFAMTSPACGSEQTRQTQDVRLVVDAIPTPAWAARADGPAHFFNQRWLDYTGRRRASKKELNFCIQVAGDCKCVRIPSGSLFSN